MLIHSYDTNICIGTLGQFNNYKTLANNHTCAYRCIEPSACAIYCVYVTYQDSSSEYMTLYTISLVLRKCVCVCVRARTCRCACMPVNSIATRDLQEIRLETLMVLLRLVRKPMLSISVKQYY